MKIFVPQNSFVARSSDGIQEQREISRIGDSAIDQRRIGTPPDDPPGAHAIGNHGGGVLVTVDDQVRSPARLPVFRRHDIDFGSILDQR
jgi:hypothetical protein